jgi:hypothetical protein
MTAWSAALACSRLFAQFYRQADHLAEGRRRVA